MPSALADGRYQLGQLVGRGGMAEVHVAMDTRLGRTVAIKIMRSDLANDEIFLARFRREAHSVAQMNNPNIVNIYDSGEETITGENGQPERLPYLVMEYVKGQTLRDIIRANGPLSQRDAEQVMLGVLNALEYSHRMGIIHRDIKPGNIMISDQGMVKVMDFGIARALDDSAATMTQSQGVVGTAQYLSPEQARGETVDMRSDLYSAGCVLYEMLTGRPPFTGDSAVAIAYQHVSEVATPPSAVVPGLPKMWDSICAKAMAKDRQNRYATAAEFKNDILTFMNGGVPVAAAFNPLTDLANMKARKQAEQDAATVPLNPDGGGSSTQAFNPATGQFEQIRPAASTTMAQTRAAQRAAALKARKRKKIVIGSLIGVAVALLVVLGVWFMVSGNEAATEQMATVPTITTSMTKDMAKAKIEAAGFTFEAVDDNDSTEPDGTFTKQNPEGGAKAARGSTVRVWFSTGPQSTKIPDVTGMTQSEARTELESAGFKVGTSVQTEDSASIAKDKVTRTNPAAGKSEPKGTTVLLYVSSGLTTIPDGLVGQSKDSAVAALRDAGFTGVTITEEYSDSVAAGNVMSVYPSSNTSVAQGTSVSLVVSKGSQPVTVPNVIGETYANAKAQLEALGFTVNQSGSASTSDRVVAQSTSSGSTAEKGATITLTTVATSSGGSESGGNSGSNSGSGSGSNSGGESGGNSGSSGSGGETSSGSTGSSASKTATK
ncbi:Stk1 family PASTA domain-containing Ser/Thr kinase [Bifidobacterium sp. MA2]|uniref:non-specific serine/threonine protein kinase n=2 Tax=Bifidobacterium santillanense TaxID=2809028 RepID=A0ABS5UP05_9BIFI|nr:Stk1 family PASTA domain-containing Ser/Thr kinase [Bifidobacterium santillanense]MBT1172665.1 Stk1 family PASTA domain-containing Ser/Thr kinase [Bifidobacterium santillanense]